VMAQVPKLKQFVSEKDLATQSTETTPQKQSIVLNPTGLAEEPQTLQELLEKNRELEEKQWQKEHNPFRPPRALDVEDVAFLKAKDDERRFRKLETELAELKELESFTREVKSRVVELSPETNKRPLSSTVSKTDNDKTRKPTSTPLSKSVKIIPQKKQKVEANEKSTEVKQHSTADDNKNSAPSKSPLGLVNYDDD